MIRVGPGGGGSPRGLLAAIANEEAPAGQGEGDDSQEGNPMNDLQIFNYQDTPVRTVMVDDEPWFVLADLCRILDLEQVSRVKARLEDGVTSNTPIQDSLGRTQNSTIVSEPGMYEVVFMSRKPEAVAFRRWITTEVLPSIRKTGGYKQVEQSFEAMTLEVLNGLQAMVAAKDETIAELEPKARAWDHIVSSEASWSFNDAAKFLFEHKKIVVGEKRLFNRCEAWGYLYRDSKKRPHAYQRSVEQGLFVQRARFYTDQETGETRESSAPQVRVTGKGLDAIFRRLTDGQLEIAL